MGSRVSALDSEPPCRPGSLARLFVGGGSRRSTTAEKPPVTYRHWDGLLAPVPSVPPGLSGSYEDSARNLVSAWHKREGSGARGHQEEEETNRGGWAKQSNPGKLCYSDKNTCVLTDYRVVAAAVGFELLAVKHLHIRTAHGKVCRVESREEIFCHCPGGMLLLPQIRADQVRDFLYTTERGTCYEGQLRLVGGV